MPIGDPNVLCLLPSGALVSGAVFNENSGFADSRLHADVFWAHEDSNSNPQNTFLYAISYDGSLRKSLNITGITNVTNGPALYGQWEDICYHEPSNTIWWANCGNNGHNQNSFWAYRITEPANLGTVGTQVNVPVEGQYLFQWEDALSGGWNCECMMVDPNGRLYFVNKEPANITGLYRAPSTLANAPSVNTLTKVASWTSQANITGGDWAADNSAIAIAGGDNDLWVYDPATFVLREQRTIAKARRPVTRSNVSVTNGSVTMTAPNGVFATIDDDCLIQGTGIQADTTIVSIDFGQTPDVITLSKPATSTRTGNVTVWNSQDESLCFTRDSRSLLRGTEGAGSEVLLVPFVTGGTVETNVAQVSQGNVAHPLARRKKKELALAWGGSAPVGGGNDTYGSTYEGTY